MKTSRLFLGALVAVGLLCAGTAWAVGDEWAVDDNGGVVTAGGSVLQGDDNGDGWVDGLDYLSWARNFGTHSGPDGTFGDGDGDFNDDGWCDGLDYLAWAGNFGNHTSSTPAPEPSTALLITLGVCTLAAFTRRRR